jgi:hypothetical protein
MWLPQKHTEKQALVVGTKQSKQANKSDRLTRQAGWQGNQDCLICIRPACFVLCLLLATSTLVLLKSMFHKLVHVQQSTFLRYLCSKHNTITNTTLSINDTQQNATGHYARIILLGVAFLLLCKVQLS